MNAHAAARSEARQEPRQRCGADVHLRVPLKNGRLRDLHGVLGHGARLAAGRLQLQAARGPGRSAPERAAGPHRGGRRCRRRRKCGGGGFDGGFCGGRGGGFGGAGGGLCGSHVGGLGCRGLALGESFS
jgi:hypothetical protein